MGKTSVEQLQTKTGYLHPVLNKVKFYVQVHEGVQGDINKMQ
jgi:hypothetical protein